MLNNWIFDDIWFFQGNIHLRNKLVPAFKVCLMYDPNLTEESVQTYGALRFQKINRQYCRKHLEQRTYSVFRLKLQELENRLPKNLLPMCETSAYLSEFDEKLNGYCVTVENTVKELQQLCKKRNAVIKEENG